MPPPMPDGGYPHPTNLYFFVGISPNGAIENPFISHIFLETNVLIVPKQIHKCLPSDQIIKIYDICL